MKKLILLLLMASSIQGSHAQMAALKPGDPVPELRFKMFHYPADSLSLSELKGKVVILDFWSILCSNCIERFPELQALQEAFKDRIFILPVGFEVSPRRTIPVVYKQLEGTPQQIGMPTAIQFPLRENQLMELFPFQGVPHYIWIDAAGNFLAATGPEKITAEMIEKVLHDQ